MSQHCVGPLLCGKHKDRMQHVMHQCIAEPLLLLSKGGSLPKYEAVEPSELLTCAHQLNQHVTNLTAAAAGYIYAFSYISTLHKNSRQQAQCTRVVQGEL